ncbi:AbrB family transcriptional regulator [Kyrpidia spormannii]|uniref:AbrB family transcriptional regulator n=1 Tax=Kyrpidia spormannii TaxID=2055160 RepID=A0A2K8NAQ3_9BACL|nr:AbrB family transcriptional regulator [Kyrpidia spormannii]ATY86195.1 AbrB family transcriptional regulator [Kyrpidia spormannii]
MRQVRRKVTRIGNSVGITFTKDALRALGLHMGDEVELTVNESNREIIIRKAPSIPLGLDPQFFEVLSAATIWVLGNVVIVG